ncbi:MAG: Asp23/Gls24 family envelope stress response protein [Actinomycetota bacterium]|nr:Asp23/Gls24 family envelope stress response protein [Actinomycetota bacterium]
MTEIEPAASPGSLTIENRVIEKIAVLAASEVQNTTDAGSGLSRMLHRDLPRATAKVAGGHGRVAIEIAAAWPTPLAELTARVRDHVKEKVTTLTGLQIDAVDVLAADMVHVHDRKRRVQ